MKTTALKKATLCVAVCALSFSIAGSTVNAQGGWTTLLEGADDCIVLEKNAKGIVARGDPRRLRDESTNVFVHNFFSRSSPNHPAPGV